MKSCNGRESATEPIRATSASNSRERNKKREFTFHLSATTTKSESKSIRSRRPARRVRGSGTASEPTKPLRAIGCENSFESDLGFSGGKTNKPEQNEQQLIQHGISGRGRDSDSTPLRLLPQVLTASHASQTPSE